MTFDVNMVNVPIRDLLVPAGIMVGKNKVRLKKRWTSTTALLRMYVVEERGKSNTHRLDEIEEDFKNAKKAI